MSEQVLDDPDVHTLFKEVRGTVSQGVDRYLIIEAGGICR